MDLVRVDELLVDTDDTEVDNAVRVIVCDVFCKEFVALEELLVDTKDTEVDNAVEVIACDVLDKEFVTVVDMDEGTKVGIVVLVFCGKGNDAAVMFDEGVMFRSMTIVGGDLTRNLF